MGISNFVFERLWNAKPFHSDPLDRLAETMLSTKILKRGKLQRYYRAPSLLAGCIAYVDTVFFDAKYYDILLPEELLAVGAHEFNHIINKHWKKRLIRLYLPALLIGALVALLTFVNFGFINAIITLSQSEPILYSLLIGLLFSIILLVASLYFNAKWFRQQETQSDFSAVRFASGEALISALTKLSKLRQKKVKRLASRLFPKLYPTDEERIADIRAHMEKKLN